MSFTAVVFDFDGLILDTETSLLEIWQAVYAQHGATLTIDLWQHALGTQHGFDPFADLARQTGIVLPRDQWTAEIRSQHWQRCEREPLQPGVLARMQEARSLGFPTAVASSSSRDWVERWLDCHGIRDLVDILCTRDDVARVKPAPDLFLLAAERLGVTPATCVVFEDSPNGLRAAHAAGMWAVAVPRGIARQLPLPACHLVLDSLAAFTLVELQRLLHRLGTTAPREPRLLPRA